MDFGKVLKDLIEIYSPSNQEREVGEYLRDWFKERELKVYTQGVGEAFNLIYVRGVPKILLSAHMDTVPGIVPYKREGNLVYGRGACDTKGSITAMLGAVERLVEDDKEGWGVVFTVGEEKDLRGIKRVIKSIERGENPWSISGKNMINADSKNEEDGVKRIEFYKSVNDRENTLIKGAVKGKGSKGDLTGNRERVEPGTSFERVEVKENLELVVVGEPTNNRVYRGQRGILEGRLVYRGKSAHSSLPEIGRNAILEMVEDINRIVEWEDPYFNIGKIWGGTATNVIPEESGFEFLVRTGEDPREINKENKEEIKLRDRGENIDRPMDVEEITGGDHQAKLDPAKRKEINLQMIERLKELKGGLEIFESIEPVGRSPRYPAFTEMYYWLRVSKEGIILGPGSLEQAHTNNEFVDIREVVEVSEKYYRIVSDFGSKQDKL